MFLSSTAMDSSGIFPVIDFSMCSKDSSVSELELSPKRCEEVSRHMVKAFSTIGFVYLLNHGIPTDLLQKAFSSSREFFLLPSEVKAKYMATSKLQFKGYIGFENESFDTSTPGDMKESFNFDMVDAPIWPTEVDHHFKSTFVQLFQECAGLSRRILKVMAYGLGLDDPDFFARCHNVSNVDQPLSSVMRSLYYPALPPASFKPGQTRLGEHTDYGSISLVFQDALGGLQVRGPGQNWIDARPIEGSVVVNIADLMQRWTADRFVSTAHRIVVPDDSNYSALARQSVVFFASPDPETEVRCIDGSDRYDPIKAGEYLKKRILETLVLPY